MIRKNLKFTPAGLKTPVYLMGILSTGFLLADPYNLEFSTYAGGSGWEHARDVAADADGNVILVGGTNSADFPVTNGALDTDIGTGGTSTGGAGEWDAFVMKFDSTGNLLWSTFLGGPNYDRAYGVEVDSDGYIYVGGRAGEGFPVTPGAVQTTFQGADQGIYGQQNGFVAKITPDGTTLEWATYIGVGWLCRDIAIDGQGNVYVPGNYIGTGPTPPAQWFSNSFQQNPVAGEDNLLIKIRSDGAAVEWATWVAGSGDEHHQAAVRVDGENNPVIMFATESSDMPTVAGVLDTSYNGNTDGYLAKYSSDGTRLIFGTYVGGTGMELMETHGLAVDDTNRVYAVFGTNSTDFPATPGALSETALGAFDYGLVKLTPMGVLFSATYIGGSDNDGSDGIYVDSRGHVVIAGETGSADFPVTGDAYQNTPGSTRSGTFIKLNKDFSSLDYATYFGGSSENNFRGMYMARNGNVYFSGSTNGNGLPVKNAFQPDYGGGPSGACCALGDATLVRFSPDSNTGNITSPKHFGVGDAGVKYRLHRGKLSVEAPCKALDCGTGMFDFTGKFFR